jgi:tight adherence protein B
MCDAFAAELEGGSPAGTALERACAPWSELAGVSAAARLGDDVGAALRRSAQLPGAEGLRAVAAAWDVAARSGAALALVLTKVAGGLRSDEEARAEVAAELSSPRATAKLLAALPLFGIGLGLSVGAEPLRFLLHTTAGLVCLSAGVALALLGMWWVEHLSSAAEV